MSIGVQSWCMAVFMDNQPPYNNNENEQPSGFSQLPVQRESNTYIDGYGFTNINPFQKEERRLRRTASLIGSGLILLLAIPVVLFYPVTGVLYNIAQMFPIGGIAVELREMVLYFASIGGVICFLLLPLKPPGKPGAMWKLPEQKAARYAVPLALAVSVMMATAMQIFLMLLQKVQIVELTPTEVMPTNFPAILIHIVRLALLPAILEEYFFRGLILQALRRYGDGFAVAFSAICYGMIHYCFTKDATAFVMGLCYGYFVIRTGSLLTSILCHFSVKLLPLLMVGFQHRFSNYSTAIALGVGVLFLLIGLIFFILLCKGENNAFIFGADSTPLKTEEKFKAACLNPFFLAALVLWTMQLLKNVHILGT